MAEQNEHVGMNKTGVQMAPIETRRMLDDDKIITRVSPGDESAAVRLRQAYIEESPNVGSIPLPGTMKGAASMAFNMLKGDKPQVLLDKLSERLAMERTATRLYDALLTKLDALHDGKLAISRDDVATIRGDEARHALLLRDAIATLGGDPTAMTPSADIVGVEAMGLVQVLNDPQASLANSLHAILTAELSDGVGWETLIALADEHEQADMVDQFSDALQQERKHQAMIQTWYEDAIGLSRIESSRPLHDADGGATTSLPGSGMPS